MRRARLAHGLASPAGPRCGRAVFALALLGAALPAQTRPEDAIAGQLFVCGGGRMPAEVLEAYIAAAGGRDARLVVIPTASARADAADADQRFAAPWRERGIDRVRVLHTRDRTVADTAGFSAPLQDATAVWISGGDQSRLAQAYGGTRVETALRAVLARGATLGGTSAGAAIQSRTMIAGGNPEPRIADGLGLVTGVIVDQHFRQRERQPRLRAAVDRFPDHVGLGVDERTALWISGQRGRVIGEGAVTVVLAVGPSEPGVERSLQRGSIVDLARLGQSARRRAAGREAPRAVGRAP